MPRLGVSLVSKAGMFWWTRCVSISGCTPWSLLCLARVRIRLFLLSLWEGGVWSVSRSGRQKCCRPNLMVNDPVDLPSVSQSHYLCLQRLREGGGSCWIWIPMVALTNWHWLCFPFLWRGQLFWPLVWLWYICGSFLLGTFPVCWRVANVTPIPKGPLSSSLANYRPISLTPTLS